MLWSLYTDESELQLVDPSAVDGAPLGACPVHGMKGAFHGMRVGQRVKWRVCEGVCETCAGTRVKLSGEELAAYGVRGCACSVSQRACGVSEHVCGVYKAYAA
eukprot:211559-Rhodomonas_salina.2